MPKLHEIAVVTAQKQNSNKELLLKLHMSPLSEKTKKDAETAAMEDMTEDQRNIVRASVL